MPYGAVYVAYGDNAQREALASITSLRDHHPDLPVAVIGDDKLNADMRLDVDVPGYGARQAKLQMNLLSPFDQTIYIDADTRIRGPVNAGFDVLGDGWDMVVTPSTRQHNAAFQHLTESDRRLTLKEMGTDHVLQLQAGVMWWRNCTEVDRLFAAWRDEWAKFERMDQGALIRAIRRTPVRIWLLGGPFNAHGNPAGTVVEHLFGRAV